MASENGSNKLFDMLRKLMSKVNKTLFVTILSCCFGGLALWISYKAYHKEYLEKNSLICHIGGTSLVSDPITAIYTFYPEFLYDNNYHGALLLSFANYEDSDITNVQGTIEIESISESDYAPSLGTSNFTARKNPVQRLVEEACNKEDPIAGNQTKVVISGLDEKMTFTFKDIQSMLEGRFQVEYVLDKSIYPLHKNAMESIQKTDDGLYDMMYFSLYYSASKTPLVRVKDLQALIWKQTELPEMVNTWREEGFLRSAPAISQEDLNQDYFHYILVYPKIEVIDNVCDVSFVDADYYSVRISNPLKCGRKRKCIVKNQRTGITEEFEQIDSKEKSKIIKQFMKDLKSL